jgi:hypothetical protein
MQKGKRKLPFLRLYFLQINLIIIVSEIQCLHFF